MAYFIGQVVGGIIGIFLLYALLEWIIFQRVLDDPVKGKLGATLAAYLVGSTLGGLGGANGGPFYWNAFADYAIPAIIVGFLALWHGKRLRERQSSNEASDVFE